MDSYFNVIENNAGVIIAFLIIALSIGLLKWINKIYSVDPLNKRPTPNVIKTHFRAQPLTTLSYERPNLPQSSVTPNPNEQVFLNTNNNSEETANSNISRKKKLKLDAKKAEKEYRQWEREQKLKRSEEKEEHFQKIQKEKELIIKQKEEQEAALLASKQQQEQEKYDKWKSLFSIQEEGESQKAEDSDHLNSFINHIKNKKMVALDELAHHFSLKIKDVIQRIQDLEQSNLLTGIFDDRGKYIYLYEEEINSLAKFINKKGRIYKDLDLIPACNQLISLNSTHIDDD